MIYTKLHTKAYMQTLIVITANYLQGAIQKFQDFIIKKKLVFFCKHFIGRLRNSPLRTEYNDLHDQEDDQMTFLGHPSVWR